MTRATWVVSVFGGQAAARDSAEYDQARRLGRLLAERGFALCNGGYGGVMEAASRGAKEAGGRTMAVRVRLAATSEHQAAGFQCATPQEIERNLILFDFGREISTQFHMQNVPAALDILFAKTDGRVFAVLQMEPSATALYGPMGDFRYALEARKGFFEAHGVRQGEARLIVPPR